MIAIKPSELRDNLKMFCDMVTGGETVIVSRPYNQNVVVLSERGYNEMLKAWENASYLAKIEKSIQDLADGKGIVKTVAELEAITGE